MYIVSQNSFTDLIPGLGLKLTTTLAIFKLGLKITISLYNKDLINDSYYFRVKNFPSN